MIFITGATGLVGKHLVSLLINEGKKLKLLIRCKSQINQFEQFNLSNVEFVIGDILDAELLFATTHNVEEIIHTAALVSFAPSDKEEMFSTNLIGTSNLVNAALENGIKRLFHISSIAALGREKTSSLITENTMWSDSSMNTPYAKSKYLAELEVWRGSEEGLNVIVLNPSVILGFGDWSKSSNKIFKQLSLQSTFFIDGGFNYIDLRDFGLQFLSLYNSNIINQRFILNNTRIRIHDIFDLYNANKESKKKLIPIPYFILKLAARLSEYKSKIDGSRPLITLESIKSLYSDSSYDTSKIHNIAPITYTSIEDTMKWLTHAYVEKYHQ